MERGLNLRKKEIIIMANLNEIRGLKANLYVADDMLLDVYREDDGVHIVQIDLDLNFISHWVINEKGKLISQFVEDIQVDADFEE